MDSGLWHTRNEFLFAFYGGGMRYSDICLFKWRHIHFDGSVYRSRFKMKKVKSEAGVLLIGEALKLLAMYGDLEEHIRRDEYVFKPLRSRKEAKTEMKIFNAISSATTVANKNLKKIQQLAGIQTKLTMHMARHSIAKFLDDQSWSIQDISKILGHSEISTTQKYLRGFQSNRLDQDYERVFR